MIDGELTPYMYTGDKYKTIQDWLSSLLLKLFLQSWHIFQWPRETFTDRTSTERPTK